MNDFLEILTNGGDEDQLLRAARWVIRSGHQGSEAMEVVRWACDVWGPEQVYMDGEIYNHEGA